MKTFIVALVSILAGAVDAQVANECIICPDGAINDNGGDSFAPYVDIDGIEWTCAELINRAKLFFSGTDACAWAEVDEVLCCFTAPVNPCSICLNGATEGLNDIFSI